MRLKSIPSNYYYLTIILLGSFITKLIYVFYFSDYKNQLTSDMGYYWEHAIDRYNGLLFAYSQWYFYATFFHFYLTFVFKMLYFFGLLNYKLQIVIFLNILYSTISVVFIYLISTRVLNNSMLALLVSQFYAFCTPIIYFNSFILSENISIPIVIISLYLIITFHNNKLLIFLTGVFFTIGIVTRPAMGLLVLLFSVYLAFGNKLTIKSLINSFIFISSFIVIVFLVLVENNYISNGELKNLAGNGGVTFFFEQCKPTEIISYYKGERTRGTPMFSRYHQLAKFGEFKTDYPLHNQQYFYKLGFECIKKNKYIWLENLKLLKGLFFGCLFPNPETRVSFLPFKILMKISDYLMFFMTISLGFIIILIKNKENEVKNILLLASIPCSAIAMSMFYVIDQRYFIPSYFAIYILFFYVISKIKKYKSQAVRYFIVISIIFCVFLLIQ